MLFELIVRSEGLELEAGRLGEFEQRGDSWRRVAGELYQVASGVRLGALYGW